MLNVFFSLIYRYGEKTFLKKKAKITQTRFLKPEKIQKNQIWGEKNGIYILDRRGACRKR